MLILVMIVGILMVQPQAWRVGLGGHEQELTQNDLHFLIRSTKERYEPGETVKMILWVRNDGSEPYHFSTAGKPVREPKVDVGLQEPRPVFDLFLQGTVLVGKEWEPYLWIWSAGQVDLPTAITLQPGESKRLIDLQWTPPLTRPQGEFILRFAEYDRHAFIRVKMLGRR